MTTLPPSIAFSDYETLIEQLPVPISVYDSDGFVVAFNRAHATLWGIPDKSSIGVFNMVTNPQLAADGSGRLFEAVMRGETVVRPPHFYDSKLDPNSPGVERRWVEATYTPLRDGDGTVTHLVALLRDVTHQIKQEQEMRAAQDEIKAQRAIIETLSSPVIQVWEGILTIPLIGIIDNRRATNVTESLLNAISSHHANSVILDITGVPVVDTQVAQHLIRTANACRLLGCDVILVGIGVEMAQTLVQLGVDLSSLVTLANLQAGVAWAFSRNHLRVHKIER